MLIFYRSYTNDLTLITIKGDYTPIKLWQSFEIYFVTGHVMGTSTIYYPSNFNGDHTYLQ
jgi:hypothetical protein